MRGFGGWDMEAGGNGRVKARLHALLLGLCSKTFGHAHDVWMLDAVGGLCERERERERESVCVCVIYIPRIWWHVCNIGCGLGQGGKAGYNI